MEIEQHTTEQPMGQRRNQKRNEKITFGQMQIDI